MRVKISFLIMHARVYLISIRARGHDKAFISTIASVWGRIIAWEGLSREFKLGGVYLGRNPSILTGIWYCCRETFLRDTRVELI